MIFGLFFNQRFEKLVDELGMRSFGDAFDAAEMLKIRDYARDVTGGKPEEAAARAFRDLIIQNSRIPVEQRLETSFERMTRIKVWHFDGKVNVDLHLGIKAEIERLLNEYVGSSYESDYYAALSNMGVITPIAHDTLKMIAFSYLYVGKKNSLLPKDAALRLYRNVLIKDQKTARHYSACLTAEGVNALAELAKHLTI